jgi:hypothetical protein
VILVATTIAICFLLCQSISDADKKSTVIVSTVALALGVWNLINQLLIRAKIRIAAVYIEGTCQRIGTHTYPFVIVFHNTGDQAGVVRIKNCYFGTKRTIMDRFLRRNFFLKYFRRKAMEICNFQTGDEWIVVEPHRIAVAKVKVECHKGWTSIGFQIERVGKHGKQHIIYLHRSQEK